MEKAKSSARPYFVGDREIFSRNGQVMLARYVLAMVMRVVCFGIQCGIWFYAKAAEVMGDPYASSIFEWKQAEDLCAINQELLSYVEPNATLEAYVFCNVYK